MKSTIKMALLSFIMGCSILFLTSIWVIADSSFNVFREWNNITIATILISLSYGLTMFGMGIFLVELKKTYPS